MLSVQMSLDLLSLGFCCSHCTKQCLSNKCFSRELNNWSFHTFKNYESQSEQPKDRQIGGLVWVA